MDIGETLYVTNRDDWRRWLAKNHDSKSEIWLVLYTKDSGKPSLPYNDAVEEALCYGWIDSIQKKHGVESRAQRYSPRRRGSPLSEMNKARVLRLHDAGKMTRAGLDAIGGLPDDAFELPDDIAAALRQDPTVWRNFESFPETYKRIRVGWIEGARSRPEVFKQRLDYFVKMTKEGKRFGMVQ